MNEFLNCKDTAFSLPIQSTLIAFLQAFSSIVVNKTANQQQLDETPDVFSWIAVILISMTTQLK